MRYTWTSLANNTLGVPAVLIADGVIPNGTVRAYTPAEAMDTISWLEDRARGYTGHFRTVSLRQPWWDNAPPESRAAIMEHDGFQLRPRHRL